MPEGVLKGGITYPRKAGLDASHSGPPQRSSSVAQDAVSGAACGQAVACSWARPRSQKLGENAEENLK